MEHRFLKNPDAPTCPHNEGVVCWPSERICETCGWDPNVAEARLEKFCRIHHIPVPHHEQEE